MRNTVRIPAAAVAIVAALSGCGSSYKGLTKAEFVKQANAICTKGNKDSDALGRQLGSNPTPAQIEKLFTDKEIPLLNNELDQIAALKPPKADRDQVKQIIAETRSEAAAFDASLKANPAKALAAGADPLKKSEDDAKAYGLTVCGSSD